MSSRRNFIQQSAALAGGLLASATLDPLAHAANHIPSLDYSVIPEIVQEDFRYEKVNGFRVTPNVYPWFEDLDELVAGIKELILKQLP